MIVGFCTKCRYHGVVTGPFYRHVRPGSGDECSYSAYVVQDEHDLAGPDLEQAEERLAREFMDAMTDLGVDLGGSG